MKRQDWIIAAQLIVGMALMAVAAYVINTGLIVTGLYDLMWYIIPVWLGAVLLWTIVIRPIYTWLTKPRGPQ